MQELLSLATERGVAVVFFATLAARLGAPIPASAVLVVAGGLVAMGQIPLWSTVLGALLGNLLGDAAWFYAGRRFGHRMMRLLCKVSLSPDTCVRQSESLITRWGGASLIAAKFVPGVSVVAPPMAGALGMSNTRFLSYETAAALIWTLGFLLLGRVFHSAINDVLAVLSNIGLTAAVFCAVMLLLFLAWRYYMRRLALGADDIAHIDVDALRVALAGGNGPTVVDVRAAASRAIDDRSIPGAVGIELKRLPADLGAMADGRELVLFCDCPDDASAIAAARVLLAAGLPRVRVLAGGLDAWMAAEAVDPSDPEPVVA